MLGLIGNYLDLMFLKHNKKLNMLLGNLIKMLMDTLVKNAQLNLSYSFTKTGRELTS